VEREVIRMPCPRRAIIWARLLLTLFWMLLSLSNAGAQQLLLMQRTWANNPANESSDCVQVEADGSYHFEHTPMSLGQAGKRQIHTGKLSDEEMKQLQGVLADSSLQSLTTPKPSAGSMMGGSSFDLLWIVIGRGNQTQTLQFNSGGESSKYATRLPSVYQTPAVKPLLDWYKQISKRKDDVDDAATTPVCSIQMRRR
jgi:hypothetical protein